MTIAQYIAKNSNYAVKEANRDGVPASITLAQGILESALGNSRLAKEANNHFGIKCHTDWYGQHITADDDKPNECFRKYKTVLDSYRDHSKFLKKFDRYNFLFRLPKTDYKKWARGLQDAGYATSNNYANSLIKIIEDNNLQRFDAGAGLQRVVILIEWAIILLSVALLIYLVYKIRKNKKTLLNG